MRKATFFYLLRRGLLTGAGGFIRDGLVMASKFITQGLTHPAQGSAEFDGASDYIQLDTPFSYTNHTIAAWVYANDTAASKYIFDNRDAYNNGITIQSNSSEGLFYRIGDGSSFNDITTTPTYANDWVFVTATYDGTTAKLYTDGSLQGSGSISISISVDSDSRIGARNYSITEYFNGNLANVAIWNRALSSDEINSVMFKSYDSLEASEKNGLQAWYRLDDISGTSVPDSSGNGNNGTAY